MTADRTSKEPALSSKVELPEVDLPPKPPLPDIDPTVATHLSRPAKSSDEEPEEFEGVVLW